MRREMVLSLFFIFMLLSLSFMIIPMAHADNQTVKYSIWFYDQKGRRINPENKNIKECASVIVYKVGWLSFLGRFFKERVFYAEAGKNISGTFTTDAQMLEIHFIWMGKDVYSHTINTASAELINGTYVIHLDMPFTPAVPINDFNVESIISSPDVHEISSKFYTVQFGTGNNKNTITLNIGGNTYKIPVELGLSRGNINENKPFRFLAQSTYGYVEGSESTFIWKTAYYYSAVRTQLVGDNMLLVVWTYGYTDITGPWIKSMVASAIAGAALGAVSGVGSIAMAGAGTLADAVIWAIKPDLMKGAGDTGVGVVAGIFTPRYFIIQGAGTGKNGTQGTVSMNLDSIYDVRGTWNGISYEIRKSNNQIQVGFTKNWGSVHKSEFFDMETYAQSGDIIATSKYGGSAKRASITSHSGQYSYYVYAEWAVVNEIIQVPKGSQIKVDFDGWVKQGSSGYYQIIATEVKGYISTGKNANNNLTLWTGTAQEIIPSSWTHIHLSFSKIADKDINITLGFTTPTGSAYFDDFQFSWEIIGNGAYRYIFDTSQSDTSITRHIFGTIPTITPTRQGTEIHQRFTLLGVELLNPNATIGYDWQSRTIEISPTRIVVKTAVWTETAWIFGTNDKNGFKNVSLVYVEPKLFIYSTDINSMYYFSGPDAWPVAPGWSPLVANNTTIYIPNGWGIPVWALVHYNIMGWWQDIGTWGHLALYGLGLLIIFIIVLIIAPWLIIALIKILSLILKKLFMVLGAVFKGIGKAMKHKRRR